MKYLVYIFITLIVLSCANNYSQAPEGGPKDSTKPYILSSSLNPGSLNVPRDVEIRVDFSEYIDLNSLKSAIYVSPYSLKDKYSVEYGEDFVILHFEKLDENQTVLFTLTSALTDMRKNALEKNFIVNFSTGNELDSCSYRGEFLYNIIGDIPERLTSYSKYYASLYNYQDVLDCTLTKAVPDYLLGIPSNGNFEFNNIHEGKYLPIVFYDKNENRKPDLVSGEYYSFGNGVIDVVKDSVFTGKFSCSVLDTLPAYIDQFTTQSSRVFKVVFSENIKALELNRVLENDSVFLNSKMYRKHDELNTCYIVSDSIGEYRNYDVSFNKIIDQWGNSTPDRMRRYPLTTDSVATSTNTIKTFAGLNSAEDDSLVLELSMPYLNELKYYVIDESEESKTEITNLFNFLPFYSILPFKRLDYIPKSCSFLIMNEADTLFYKNSDFKNEVGLGSVTFDFNGDSENIIFLIKQLGSRNQIKEKLENVIDKEYFLKPGKYTFFGFEDRNGNGLFDGGALSDYIDEKSFMLSDTVEVRKNWETAGIKMDLR
ncbi:MAG: Ig-like domain-containing protein [Candidatus Delongbacteria bacterium]|nr:Ig-like domain-containing protein [Candidatus Delongbacteria bacterium]MBN2836822.1 Ig-like domain-containing protein [Candidatus Delongbacteria bacterium]